jgi:hypothetical protein
MGRIQETSERPVDDDRLRARIPYIEYKEALIKI